MTLPDSVVTIQDQAFAECSQLTSLDLGDGVQFIGANAFWGAGITSLALPDSLATLEDFAFAYCESLTSIEWPDNEDFTTVTGFGGCTALPVEEFNEVVSLPSVTALGTEAFSYCTFESVTIPSGIRTIGEGAFWGADSMKSLTIMPGVTYIESDAFANCSGLAGTTIVVPETVISIGGNAFGGCAKEQQMTGEEGFIYYAFTEVTVEIRNRDFSLSPKSDYYSYAPVTIDGTDYENPFGNATVIRAYETDSQGNPSMMYRLYEVLKDVEIYPDNTQHKQKAYRFEALTDAAVYTVSGSIPEGASVLLRRDGREIPVTVTGNRFSAEVTSGADVSVTVKLDGYYDKYFLPESGSVLNGDWDLGNITLEKIPQNRSMSIDFDGGTVKDFQGLEFTLKAGNRTLEEGTDYTLQYPYIILSESLEEEELTLSVNADSLGYTGGSVTAKRADGTFVLPLTPWGKLHITTAGTFAGDNHILVFNQKGELVGKSTVSKDGMYITDRLKAGSYEIIAYNANSSFASVSTIHALEALGLSEGRDYAKMTADVSDNCTCTVCGDSAPDE
ncbi:MAG: leucine-rich repeat domain-containing protein [Lachnoclostridium sp.]